jgi:hypothetical protein
MPICNEQDRDIYENFGALISLILTSEKCLSKGLVLNPDFYSLLSKTLKEELSIEKISALIAKSSPPTGDQYNTFELQLRDVIDWYLNPTDDKSFVITYLKDILSLDVSEEGLEVELKKLIEENILENYKSQAEAIIFTSRGMTSFAKLELKHIEPGDESEMIQGKFVTAEALIDAISNPQNPTPGQLEKIQWIKDLLEEKAADTVFLSKFLFFVTGQRFVTHETDIKLRFHNETSFKAETCFNTLVLPKTLIDLLDSSEQGDVKEREKSLFMKLLKFSLETINFTMS